MKRDIILVGGGGHCKSVIDVAEMAGYNILGILDTAERLGEKVLSSSIIGCDDDILEFIDKADFLITVGFIKNPSIRTKLFNKIKDIGGKFATIIAPTAHVSKYATVGEGSIVMHNVVINAEATIGENCIINTFANVEHESIIGNNCHISTGVMINGGCSIGDNIFIGSQSVIAQGIHISSDIIISAGALVHKDIKLSGVYVGNPIRKIK